MARRRSNSHKIVAGAWKLKIPGLPSHTAAGRGRVIFAKPPIGGWPGGDPKLNGCPWA